LIVPSTSFSAPAGSDIKCSALFQPSARQSKVYELQLKNQILEEALAQTRIQIPKDDVQVAKVLKQWDLTNSTPAKMEVLAQAIVLKLNKRRTFAQWLKNIISKSDGIKEAVRVRVNTLILKRELLDALEVRHLLKKDSKFDKYKDFRKVHFNKIQLAKLVAINSATIYFLGLPLYFPSFDWIHNLDLSDRDLDLALRKDFNAVYPKILSNYKKELQLQRVTEHAPQILFLSMAAYAGYNYLKFQSLESTSEVTTTVDIPQSSQLFLEWKKSYEERTGKTVDLTNAEDRKEWDTTVQSIYRAWSEMFNEKEGRYPDLSKEQDLKAWEKFLSTFQS
jgi:hypothetical protein